MILSGSWLWVAHGNFQRLNTVRGIKPRKLERERQCPVTMDALGGVLTLRRVPWEELVDGVAA